MKFPAVIEMLFLIGFDKEVFGVRAGLPISADIWCGSVQCRKKSALMSYNIFTFPSEAQMLLHIKIWETRFPEMFEKLTEAGCTAYSYNQVWNSPGTFKTSVMFEYESPEAFKACQEVMKEFTAPFLDELQSTGAVIEASRNVIRHAARIG